MNKRDQFINEIKVDMSYQYKMIDRKLKIYRLIDEHPELLNSLPFEKLKMIKKMYEEDYIKKKKK